MVLAQPYALILLLFLPLIWFKMRGRQFVGISDLRLAGPARRNLYLHKLPLWFFSVAYVCIVVAIARPQVSHLEGTEVINTRDILVGVDISASMGMPFEGELPPPEKGSTELDKELPPVARVPDQQQGNGRSTGQGRQRRIDAAQSAVTRFVRQRFASKQGDRIGIMAFDTEPHWSWPLTDDLKMIYRKGVFIDQGLGGGTNFGNINPGPIDAACEHFDERGKAATKVLILVTDGEDSISYFAMSRLVSALKDRDVHFYVIGVGETLARNDVDIIQLAQTLGGRVFRVENAADLAKCFDSISEMERSAIKVESRIGYHDVFFYFALAALVFISLAVLSDAFIVSR